MILAGELNSDDDMTTKEGDSKYRTFVNTVINFQHLTIAYQFSKKVTELNLETFFLIKIKYKYHTYIII